MTTAAPRFPGGYADYIVHHERQPGIGSLAGWRGRDGTEAGRGEPNPEQLERYIEQWLLLAGPNSRPRPATSSTPTGPTSTTRCGWASSPRPSRSRSSFTARCCRSSGSRRRAMARCSRPSISARGSEPISTRCRSGTRRSRIAPGTPSASRCTRSPSGRWRCTIPGARERLAAPDPRLQPPLSASRPGGSARRRGRRLGLDHQPARPDQGPGPPGRRGQSKHVLDLERDRQARGCLEPVDRRAGGTKRLPAQSPDRRASARARRRLSLRQRRPGDRPGGLVRSAGADRARRRRRGRHLRAAIRSSPPAAAAWRRPPKVSRFGLEFRRRP